MDAAIAELRQQLLDMNRDHGHSVSNVTNDKADRHEVRHHSERLLHASRNTE